jgi:transcriptional regulator MraZ
MFVGTYEVRLDTKHRVTVPQKLRETGGDRGSVSTEFYITVGPEGCLFAYTPEGWAGMMEALGATQPLADRNLRQLQRTVAALAVRCELDSQSRIVLSEKLRTYAGLKRDVLWVGAVGRAEIWDAGKWQAYQDQHVAELGDMFDIAARAGIILQGGCPSE